MKNPILLNLPMPITTKHLLIRPPKTGDGSIFFEAVKESYDDLNTAFPWTNRISNADEAEAFVRESEANWILKSIHEPYFPLLIFIKEPLHFVGIVGYHHVNWQIPALEIGYWCRSLQRGRGLITEAVNAITQYAFQIIKVKRIEIRCDTLNIKSKVIPERLGYQLDATLKNHRISSFTQKLGDTLIYSRTDLKNIPCVDFKTDGKNA